jgi:hypothetical protein
MCAKGINFVSVSMISRLYLGSDDVVFLFFIDNYNNTTSTLQQYFSYIEAVRFIGGGNKSTRRKPPNCHKSLTNFIT